MIENMFLAKSRYVAACLADHVLDGILQRAIREAKFNAFMRLERINVPTYGCCYSGKQRANAATLHSDKDRARGCQTSCSGSPLVLVNRVAIPMFRPTDIRRSLS